MTILKYLNKIFNPLRSNKSSVAYVEVAVSEADVVESQNKRFQPLHELDEDIDLSTRADLEDYARGLSVSPQSIERWISSGLLMPEELKVAEKLIKIMRRH